MDSLVQDLKYALRSPQPVFSQQAMERVVSDSMSDS